MEGHEYQATVRSRIDGRACRICIGSEIKEGVNDFATLYPTIAEMWHPSRNDPISASQIGVGGKTSYWWMCPNGHEYKSDTWAKILGKECRTCSGFLAQAGESDFATIHPDLVQFLDPLHHSIEVLVGQHPGSEQVFNWKCASGHTWRQSLKGIKSKKLNPCSYCSNNKVWPGFNDLQTKNPEIASEWDFELNSPVRPHEVLYRADKPFHWLCKEHGHSWKVSVYKRAEEGSGCPYCGNYFCLTGFNDLETLFPEIAAQWDSVRNVIGPSQVLARSQKSAWWICIEGHKWRAKPGTRVGSENRRGSGCPGCAKSGFDASQPADLYFIENEKLQAFKVGITNLGTSRIFNFKGKGWKLIHKVSFQYGVDARKCERAMQRWLKDDLGLESVAKRSDMGRLGGQTETFSSEVVTKDAVVQKLTSLAKEKA